MAEDLVVQIYDLDNQIQQSKDRTIHGESITKEEINMFVDNITQRTLLNHELTQVRTERNRLRENQ